MLLNLIIGDQNKRVSNYINIDPLAQNETDTYRKGDISNLDWIAADGEVEHLIARNILSYFPTAALGQIIQNWLKKVKIGGTITIEDLDFESVCHALAENRINPNEAQELLWGKQSKQWDIRKTGISIFGVIDLVKKLGFKISKNRFEGHNFVIVAQRG